MGGEELDGWEREGKEGREDMERIMADVSC